MEQYIDKSALIAEIEKCYYECLKRAKITDSDYWNAKADAYRNVLTILDNTLEVKEVDLEKEIAKYLGDDWVQDTPKEVQLDMIGYAKHFFELGLKVAQKGEKV